MRFYRRRFFRLRWLRSVNPTFFRQPLFGFGRSRLPRSGNRGNYLTFNKTPLILLMLLSFIIVSYLFFTHVEKKLTPTILVIAQARSKQVAIETINTVVKEKIAGNIEYEELINVHKDNNERIVLLQPNISKINRLQAETALAVNSALKNLERQKSYIPLGQVSDSYLLANYGPKIPVRLSPLGTVDVERIDEFESAGINQTRHLLSFKVKTKVRIYLPLTEDEAEVVTEVLIADNILIGEVPQTYLNLDFNKLNPETLLKE